MTVDPDTARLLVDEEDEAGARVWDGQRWLRDGLPLGAASGDPALEFSPEGRLEGALDRDGVRRTYGYTPRAVSRGWLGPMVARWWCRTTGTAGSRKSGVRAPGWSATAGRRADRPAVSGGRVERQPINPGSGADRAYAVRDGAGREVRSFYAGDELVAWEDPRGLRTTPRPSAERVRLQLPTGGSGCGGGHSGRLAQLTGPRGGQWRWTWSPHGVVSRRDPTGRMERSTFDEQAPLQSVFRRTPLRPPLERGGPDSWFSRPNGAETLVERDEQGQVSALVDAAGSRLELDWEQGQVATIRRRDGGVWSLDRDLQGRVTALDSPKDGGSRCGVTLEATSSRSRTPLRDGPACSGTSRAGSPGHCARRPEDGTGARRAWCRHCGPQGRWEHGPDRARRIWRDSPSRRRGQRRGHPTGPTGPAHARWARPVAKGPAGRRRRAADRDPRPAARPRPQRSSVGGLGRAWTLGIQHDAAGFRWHGAAATVSSWSSGTRMDS